MAYNIFSEKTGNVFENEVVDRVRIVAKQEGAYFQNTVGTERDRCDGTDLIYGFDRRVADKIIRNRIPIDVTYNFAGKDRMIVLPAKYTLACGIKLRFGVRFGNRKKTFDEPVLVIGFETDSYCINSMMENIMDDVQREWSEIFLRGRPGYRKYCPIKG